MGGIAGVAGLSVPAAIVVKKRWTQSEVWT